MRDKDLGLFATLEEPSTAPQRTDGGGLSAPLTRRPLAPGALRKPRATSESTTARPTSGRLGRSGTRRRGSCAPSSSRYATSRCLCSARLRPTNWASPAASGEPTTLHEHGATLLRQLAEWKAEPRVRGFGVDKSKLLKRLGARLVRLGTSIDEVELHRRITERALLWRNDAAEAYGRTFLGCARTIEALFLLPA